MSKSAADVISTRHADGGVVFGQPTAASVTIDGSELYGKNINKACRYVTDPPLRPDSTTPAYLIEKLAE